MKSTLPKEPSSSPEFARAAAPIRIDRPQFIYHNGKRAFAVVPIEDWERIVDALDDLEDIFFLEERLADPERELLPAAMVDALLNEGPVKVWREHRGLSQRQLAELAGISTACLSQLEAGGREASKAVIRRLAHALGVEVDELIRLGAEAPR